MNTTPQQIKKPVDYALITNALRAKGIALTDKEAEKLEAICEEERKTANLNHDLLGYSLGNDITSWVYMLFAFIQGVVHGKGDFTMAGIGDRVSNAADNAGERGKLKSLSDSCARINMKLTEAGGNLALAAPLVSGNATGTQALVDMENSFFRQNRVFIDQPQGAPIALNRPKLPCANASAGENYAPNSNGGAAQKSLIDGIAPSA